MIKIENTALNFFIENKDVSNKKIHNNFNKNNKKNDLMYFISIN